MYVVASRAFESKVNARAVPDKPINLKAKTLANLRPFGSVSMTRKPKRPPKPKVWPKIELLPPAERSIAIKDIQMAVIEYFGGDLTIADLISARRTRNVVWPRQIGMFLVKKITLKSLPDIGRGFGGRDHTTILYGYRKVQSKLGRPRTLAAVVGIVDALRSKGFTIPTFAELGIPKPEKIE